MNKYLEIILDDQSVLKYERRRLPGLQRSALDRMDEDMQAGIRIDDQVITDPARQQCALFVVTQLHQAIGSERSNKAMLMCSWLATRLPDLRQILISTNNDRITCEFIQSPQN